MGCVAGGTVHDKGTIPLLANQSGVGERSICPRPFANTAKNERPGKIPFLPKAVARDSYKNLKHTRIRKI